MILKLATPAMGRDGYMADKIKVSSIFEQGHNNNNLERIMKWAIEEHFSVKDLIAIACIKFALLPQVRKRTITSITDSIQVCGDRYNIIIAKVNDELTTDKRCVGIDCVWCAKSECPNERGKNDR